MADPNQQIIEEFRANDGRVGGHFEGRTLLLLHHTGAKTGTERINPLAYQRLSDDSVAIFASQSGAPTNPDWFYNVVAHPDVKVEIGTETFAAHARVAEGARAGDDLGEAEGRLARLRGLRGEDDGDPRDPGRRPRPPATDVTERKTGPPRRTAPLCRAVTAAATA